MPRTFDFDSDDPEAKRQAYADGQTLPYLSAKRTGKNEIDLREIRGPHGLFFMDAENHQFRRIPKSGSTSRNGDADQLFDWLDKHAMGRWHWMEMSGNHGHSISTSIWVDLDADTRAFLEAFPEQLKFDEKQHLENAEIKRKCATSETGMHPAMNSALLADMVRWNDQESRNYIANIGNKPGFPRLFAKSIGELRAQGKLEENDLLNRLADIIDKVIPGSGREAVVAYLDRTRTAFVDAMFDRLEPSLTLKP